MIDIAWSQFTPAAALTGGILIGLAAASFLLLNGRIAGISGILGGLLTPVRTDILWRVAFLTGLIGAPAVWALFAQLPPVEINAGYSALIVAGLLVGIGTRYASGCTSGHGVCGLSRLSLRSLVATLSFLDIAGLWDPSLAFVMGAAIIVGLVSFAVARKRTLSFLGFNMKLPTNNRIEKRMVIGSMMFGIGWGIAGFCPGPGLVALGAGEIKGAVFVASMVAGMVLFELFERNRARGDSETDREFAGSDAA